MTFKPKSDGVVAAGLLLAGLLWGANNTGTKFIVSVWPPIWTGGARFLCAGLLMLGLLRWTRWLGSSHELTPAARRRLWWRGGVSLAVYIVVFNWAVRLTSASHVALYLGASPVWALLWEGPPQRDWHDARRYGAAVLALTGVLVLFGPSIFQARTSWPGELLGVAASVLWTHFGRECRVFAQEMSGAEVSAHTMWRAGVILLLVSVAELRNGLVWRWDVAGVLLYCILAGSVAAFAIWNTALRHWPTSRVLLFNNLIPLNTMAWARACLGERVSALFWPAMGLIAAGVVLGQVRREPPSAARLGPQE
jgi:drug/metabolite transporter (DMT)-like permease